MLTPAYFSTLLEGAIKSCYLPDSEGHVMQPLPNGETEATIKNTIEKLTLTTNYSKEVFGLLADACSKDLSFDSFMFSIYNCESIPVNMTTHEAAEEYLLRRGLLC